MAPPAARRLAGPQALFLRVRTLLRTNQAAQAAQLATADLARHTRSGSTHDGWLWRTAGLFRSYDQPHLALRLFARLQRRLPVPTHARVAALQAASQLVWNDPRPEPQRPPDPGHHAQHAHLAHSLLELASHHLRGASTPRTTAPTPNTRVLEVVLANILKLGDMDWIVSILRDFYPRYTHQLGLHLYPPSPSGSHTPPSEGPLAPDELPSGRLVKFLVTGYMACKDLRRAYGVVCFHRRAVEQAGASEAREVTAEVTFLRGVSRTTQGGLARRMGMVAGVLESLGRRGGVELDSYALDGLLEMRYRMRAGWGFRRPQQATLAVLAAALARLLALFLLHRARPPILRPPPPGHNTLIQGPHQGQHTINSWKYRPSPLIIGLLLRALRDLLRFQTRPTPRPALPTEGAAAIKSPRKRRPSPGTHRAILAQILALDHHARAALCRPLAGRPAEDERLPTRLDLLPAKNVLLLVECLLLARDYAAVWVLLARPTVSAEARAAAHALVHPLRAALHPTHPAPHGLNALLRPTSARRVAADTDAPSIARSMARRARRRRARDSPPRPKASTRPSCAPPRSPISPSVQFLRKAAAVAQLDLIAYGIAPPDAGHSLDQ
ncbi:hypothetical protein PTTG_27033 [Puccinia triticina 1-1 BBBD Race 1]|uniref:Uncharacterized protein n=1 Tax=Puccinia triticina (isolate 1-1 / race 1 (BBBD)) TaxID=630390 RepID=A0A180GQQ1_PUCT1|nr:hypothetical protein PTTG_27033 [Puccinia triticina 1-1 BBBD Race 1]